MELTGSQFAEMNKVNEMIEELSSRQNSKEIQIRQDLLQVAIVDIFLNLKKEINKYNHNMDRKEDGQSTPEKEKAQLEKEQKRLLSLGNLVLVDYVRSMVDLLLDYMHTTRLALQKHRKLALQKHRKPDETHEGEQSEYREGQESQSDFSMKSSQRNSYESEI